MTERNEYIITVIVTVRDSTEETYEFAVILLRTETGLTFLEVCTVCEVIIKVCVGREVSIVSIEI